MTMFDTLHSAAIVDRMNLEQAGNRLALAWEADVLARDNARNLRAFYEADEAAFLVEATANATGKNAEARKAEIELALATARLASGELGSAWANHQRAAKTAAEVAAHLEVCKVHYSTAKANAALTAAMLTALTAEPQPA